MDQKDTFQQLLEQHIYSSNKFKKDKYVITIDIDTDNDEVVTCDILNIFEYNILFSI